MTPDCQTMETSIIPVHVNNQKIEQGRPERAQHRKAFASRPNDLSSKHT